MPLLENPLSDGAVACQGEGHSAVTRPGNLAMRRITSDGEFRKLAPAWQRLTQEPLRSFEWNFSWWQNFGAGSELSIYCYSVDGIIVAIAPMFIDRWLGQRRLRFLGSGKTCSDYAQIIAAPNHRAPFIAAIAAEIRESSSIHLIELEGICSRVNDSDLFSTISSSFRKYEQALEPAWILELPENWEQFLRRSKTSLRRKIKKAEKRMESGEVQIRSTREDLDFKIAFAVLVELHQERFVSKGQAGVFSDARFTNFLEHAAGQLIRDGRAEIVTASSQGQPFVAQLYLHGETGPQLYQSGARSNSMALEPGHLLFSHAVRKAIEGGFPMFDFLRGSESYKPFWGAQPRPLSRIRLVSSKIIPRSIHSTYELLRGLKHRWAALVSNPATREDR